MIGTMFAVMLLWAPLPVGIKLAEHTNYEGQFWFIVPRGHKVYIVTPFLFPDDYGDEAVGIGSLYSESLHTYGVHRP